MRHAATAILASLAGLLTACGDEPPADPHRDVVVSMCRDAAADETSAFVGEEIAEFVATEVTHEERDGKLYYRASGYASKSDGYGGSHRYSFDCKVELEKSGQDGTVRDIIVLS